MQADDIIEIVNLINLYPAAVDTQQWDLLDRVFTEDATTDFGGNAAFSGLVVIKQVFAAIHEPFDSTQHVTTNHQVVVKGDTATCLSYVHGRFIRDVGEGGNMYESTGWYDDKLVRTGEGWRIRVRNCRSVWWGGNPRVLQTTDDVNAEPELSSLRAEVRAGKVAHAKALAQVAG
jgi:ketosteroid isomerase-like protein